MPRAPLTAIVLAAALVLSACGDDEPVPTATSSPTATAAPAESPSSEPEDVPSSEPAPTSEDDDGVVIELTVEGGEVSGADTRPVVPLGSEATISVTSDVDDVIHLHGYDIHQDVAAGSTAELTFTADIPGVFEVELENAGLRLVEVEVR